MFFIIVVIDKINESKLEECDDLDEFNLLSDSVQHWWFEEFGEYIEQNNGMFTPPQKRAIPSIKDRKNTLIASPTGSGKSLASFTSIIDDLIKKDQNNELEDSIYCVYVSPLKSLTNDIKRNLEKPLSSIQNIYNEESNNIRQATRHGDTTDKEKRKMSENPPHIINTTPETLAILLNSPKFKQNFETVEYIIVDEIHSLAESKRGSHLSVSLERLENMSDKNITRIGCSATIEPLDKVSNFLVGSNRDCNIVDTRFVRDYDIKLECPVDNIVEEEQSKVQEEFYSRLNDLVSSSSSALIFTNTRSGSERVLYKMRERYNYNKENSGCHHSSISRSEREKIEDKLKNGELDFVTSSTSLELGIDMPDIDMVIQIGSPKSVASLMQRVGRAGHQIGETVKGRVLVLNRDDLVECSVMTQMAEEGYIDRIFIPNKPQDVLAQQVYGMAINKVRPKEEIYSIIKKAYPYRNYSKEEFNILLKYLKMEYDELEDKNVYSKIWVDDNDPPSGEYHYDDYPVGEELIGKIGKMARVIYMTNIGTIPDSFNCTVKIKGTDNIIGTLDEDYLNKLDKGEVFVLKGDRYEYQYRRESIVYVTKTNKSATVPSWYSERLPLSYDLAKEILSFQDKVLNHLENGKDIINIFEDMPIDKNSAMSLKNLYINQYSYVGKKGFSTLKNLPIEKREKDNKIDYYFMSIYGRRFNDGLSRVLAQTISDKENINVKVSVDDQGFTITVPKSVSIDIQDIFDYINKNNIENILRKSLEGTDFLKRYFRINATRSLMILKNYKGNKKSSKRQQVSSEMLLGSVKDIDDFVVLEETYREIMEDKLDIEKIKKFLNSDISLNCYKVKTPSPRAFSLATLSSKDVVRAEDQKNAIKRFHEEVKNKINN